ncbi:MAG: hypothetical protein LAT82_02055 [Nanoarchaeota archaeon]|nr:hypothetical protein [Nanoarchaeota archaeon]
MYSKLVLNLFWELEKENIDFCIFKSLERLDKDLSGDGEDIDILFNKKDLKKLEPILRKNNFKKVLWPRNYNGIFMYVGYDFDKNKTFSLHFHYKLRFGPSRYILGKKIKLKEYRWNFEKLILKNKITKNEINIISEKDEFLFLIARLLLKNSFDEDDTNRCEYLRKNLRITDFPKKDFIIPMEELLLKKLNKRQVKIYQVKYLKKLKSFLLRSSKLRREKILNQFFEILNYFLYSIRLIFGLNKKIK